MAKKSEDARLTRLSEICLAFPEATREDSGSHATFRVRKKVFAYFLDDHHGDGIVSLCCKVPPMENAELVAVDPQRFYMPAYIAARGWVGVRLDRGPVDWSIVTQFAANSYRMVAPKRLAAQLEAAEP